MFIYLPKDEKEKEFVITKGGEGYLPIFEIEQWNLFVEKLNDLPTDDRNARVLKRHFLGSAESIETNDEAACEISNALYCYCGGEEEETMVCSVEEYKKENANIIQAVEKYAKYVVKCK